MDNQTDLPSLPNDLLNQILLQVGSSSITDLASAKIAIREFNEISQEDQFLKVVDLIFTYSPHWGMTYEMIANRNTCLQQRNPTALFLKGLSDFFRLHILDDGLALLSGGAQRGDEMSTYCYTMLRLVMSGTDNGFCSVTHIDRKDAISLRLKIKKSGCRAWEYPLSKAFVQQRQQLEKSVKSPKCDCPKRTWGCRFVCHMDGKACNSCFWKLEAILFCQTMPDHVLI